MTRLLAVAVLTAVAAFFAPRAHATPPVHATPACKGVVDRTEACGAPAREKSGVLEDAKAAPFPAPSVDPAILPGELGFFAVLIGVAGGATIAATYVIAPQASVSTDDEAVRNAVRLGGVSLLGLAGLTASAAAAFTAFDPSTGALRFESIKKEGP